MTLTGQPPVDGEEAADGLDRDGRRPLHVGGAARIEASVALRRLERRRVPELQRVDGLHVVMAVDDQGRAAGRAGPFAEHRRLAAAVEQLHILQADGPQPVQQEFASRRHAARILGCRSRRWGAEAAPSGVRGSPPVVLPDTHRPSRSSSSPGQARWLRPGIAHPALPTLCKGHPGSSTPARHPSPAPQPGTDRRATVGAAAALLPQTRGPGRCPLRKRNRMSTRTVAELMIETLARAGVERMYGVVGDSLNGLTELMRRRGDIEWIHTRHEEAAAFAAGAEAHLTGKLAVCAGSLRPGNLHLINGLFDCHRSRVPVLAIAAQIPSNEIGRGYFQETHPASAVSGVQPLLRAGHPTRATPGRVGIGHSRRNRQARRSGCRHPWRHRAGQLQGADFDGGRVGVAAAGHCADNR